VTRASFVAGLAGLLAAAALVELAAAVGESRRRVRSRRPRRTLALLGGLGRRLGPLAPPKDLADRLAAAGVGSRVGPGDLMAIKGGAALAAFVLGLPLGTTLPGRLPWLVAVAAPLAAFLAPDLWLRRRARARGRAMDAELPDLLDLLVVALEAGLPLSRALGEVGRRAAGPLAGEWHGAALEATLGVPLDAALEGLGRRCPAPGMPALVAALRRGARHGAPLAETLAAQAAEVRAARARRMRDAAARAAPKIQLVVALGLVPSVLLLVGAALVSSLLH
jgi:tight adherence protein C